MTRVAAFDCGTNSLRLLIADIDVDAGTSTTLSASCASCGWARVSTAPAGSRRPRCSACSPRSRSTWSRARARRRARCGSARPPPPATPRTPRSSSPGFASGSASPEVLDGLEEARVSFAGATRDLPPLPEPLLVVDIGGGSTELILGHADGTIVGRESLDIGSVRLNERHLPATRPRRRRSSPPSRTSTPPSTRARSTRGRGRGHRGGRHGDHVAAGVLDLSGYDRELIHHSVLRPDAVQGGDPAAHDVHRAAQGPALHASRPRRRHRRGRPHPRPACCGVRRSAPWWSPSTTSSTGSPGPSSSTRDGKKA